MVFFKRVGTRQGALTLLPTFQKLILLRRRNHVNILTPFILIYRKNNFGNEYEKTQ